MTDPDPATALAPSAAGFHGGSGQGGRMHERSGSTMRLFVYGTLMRGERAEALMANARFLAAARTEPRFTLVDMGGHPALVQGGRTAVSGELYEVPEHQLEALDRYEEAPELYRREPIHVGGGRAWAYLLPAAEARGHPRLPSGDWRRR